MTLDVGQQVSYTTVTEDALPSRMKVRPTRPSKNCEPRLMSINPCRGDHQPSSDTIASIVDKAFPSSRLFT
jgi:hypothetical protein